MDQGENDTVPSPTRRLATLHLLSRPLSPSLQSLLRALELAPMYGLGFDRIDVARVEAQWEMLEDDSTAHGFVLALRDGRRCYLQYIAAYDQGDVIEDIETLPMCDERYPSLSGGGIVCDDRVGDLNRVLAP